VALIYTRALDKRYGAGVCALRDISLEIEQGEWIAIMGPSGSGKTTLLNILGGLDRPTSGSVEVAGVDLGALDQAALTRFRRENVGLVFQQFHLVPYLTALENVMLAQYYHSLPDAPEAEAALVRVGLGHRTRHLPRQLSGGEQQRVCIARALINSPLLLLADEPTGNLDEENEEIVLRLFGELHSEGRTILTVTHDPDVGDRADRRVLLEHGRLLSGTASRAVEDDRYDHILEEIWLLREGSAFAEGERRVMGLPADNPRLIARLIERGLLIRTGGEIRFTDVGEGRASDIVRRRRLAERLFADSFHLSQDEIESGACRFEHILSPAATESICRFLGHPSECPHGRPIPSGMCCAHGHARGS
jgi:putative ABC transport system ATP-binding protein